MKLDEDVVILGEDSEEVKSALRVASRIIKANDILAANSWQVSCIAILLFAFYMRDDLVFFPSIVYEFNKY